MLIRYARVPTSDRNLNLQTDALSRAGCNEVFTDTASGADDSRSGLSEALKFMREGMCLLFGDSTDLALTFTSYRDSKRFTKTIFNDCSPYLDTGS